jgi:hypothetical protein
VTDRPRRDGETDGESPTPPSGTTGTSDASGASGAAGSDQWRAVAGGLALVVAVLGFTATRALVRLAGRSDEWVLVALPAFGVVGVVGFVHLVSAVVRD